VDAKRRVTQSGDSFDERIVEGDTQSREVGLFSVGSIAATAAIKAVIDSATSFMLFPTTPLA